MENDFIVKITNHQFKDSLIKHGLYKDEEDIEHFKEEIATWEEVYIPQFLDMIAKRFSLKD